MEVICKVYKSVELLKFLEVEGIKLTIGQELHDCDNDDSYSEDRQYLASILVFALNELGCADDVECEEIITANGKTPNQALALLARMLEGQHRVLYKSKYLSLSDEYVIGDKLIIPPLKHTECDIKVIEETYMHYDDESSMVKEFDYSKYE